MLILVLIVCLKALYRLCMSKSGELRCTFCAKRVRVSVG
jgi:hypothetical protein